MAAVPEVWAEMSVSWWANFIGIIFSGTGAFILAYDIFSFKPKSQLDTLTAWAREGEHKQKNQNLIKAAMILIPLGAALQLLAQLLDS